MWSIFQLTVAGVVGWWLIGVAEKGEGRAIGILMVISAFAANLGLIEDLRPAEFFIFPQIKASFC
jgi:hypothetical protein